MMTLEQVLANTKLQARPYQKRIITKALCMYMGRYRKLDEEIQPASKSVMIESPTGCLVGETVVNINLNGKGIRTTMAEAFIHFHGGDPTVEFGYCACGCGGKTKIPEKSKTRHGQIKGIPLRFINGHQARAQRWAGDVKVRAYKGEAGIGLQSVLNIVQSGVKEVLTLTLDDGKTLTGTACHPVLTTDGYVPLGQLTVNDEVLTDRLNPTGNAIPKAKLRDTFLWNAWNHPYGRKVKTTKEARGYTVRVPKHVMAYEMAINNLTYREYVGLVRHGDPSSLILVDPAVYVVHHRDGNHYNNDPINLEVKTHLEHNRDHGINDHYRNFGNREPGTAKVMSVVPAGKSMTYDICCDQPYHNFVANGIVVHNSGKTSMALVLLKMMQQEVKEKYNEDLIIGWVAMRRNLLAQASQENTEKNINVENIHFVSMFDKSPTELIEARAAGKKILLVIDEAQHDAANSMGHLHNVIIPDYVLGMTATPFRTDRMKLCFDNVIKDAGIHSLIQDGFLSKFDHYTIDNWNVETVTDTYLSDPKRWGQSIFYFPNLEDCFRANGILRESGIACDVVTGESDTETQLAAFRMGTLAVLINCHKLTEGFNDPSLETAFVRPSGKGCTMQMAGRAFRIHPNGKIKNIVQSKQSAWPIVRTAMPSMQYVWSSQGGNTNWLSLTVNPLLDKINRNARQAIAEAIVEVPEFITNRTSKRVKKLRF